MHDTFAIAYFCNGSTQEAWLKGTPHDGKLSMTGKNNASLTANYALGHARGTVVVDGIAHIFSIIAVHKPSGLFQSIAVVRGATIKAGWIVLANGTQVGSLEPNANVRHPVRAGGAEARPLLPDGAVRRHHAHRHADRRRNRQRVLTSRPLIKKGNSTWQHNGSRPRRRDWIRSSPTRRPGCSSCPRSSAAWWR